MKIKIVNKSNNPLPEYAKPGDAGCDLRADLTEKIIIFPSEGAVIPTGIHVQIPYGYHGEVTGRSGLNFKKDIIVPKGCIDSGYTGEIKVKLYNLSKVVFIVEPGDKIAQLVVTPVEKASWIEVDELDESERGDNGFGSTGR